MGREIRRVPPNWEHPRRDCPHSPWNGGCDEAKKNDGKCFKPLYDQSFEDAAKEWKKEYAKWEDGIHPDYCSEKSKNLEFWEYHGDPPDRESYRPKWECEPTWYQVYETVSEGTPVTPPFETQEELIDYLIVNGDYWDQLRAKGDGRSSRGWSRDAARNFVKNTGWAPSLIVQNGKVMGGAEGLVELLKQEDGE